jgi:hypothetical protein
VNGAANAVEGCWAASLGNCGGRISREHLVSECLFADQSVFVQGLDWCLDAPKEVRIESLTGKVLCETHNRGLSELDAAASAGFEAIRLMAKLSEERGRSPFVNWAHRQIDIDGERLERWFLKTLINFSFNRNLIIGPGDYPSGVPSQHLVRIAFGLEQFSSGQGLYTAYRSRETFMLEDRFGFTAKARGANLLMGAFVFRGLRFYLNLLPQRFESIEDSSVFYHQAHFAQLLGNRESHRISLRWP